MFFKKDAVVSTRRLVLRGISEADALLIVSWRNDPNVYRYFKIPHAITLEEHQNWFRTRYLMMSDRFDFIIWKGDIPIGTAGAAFEDDETVEVSYLLDPAYQGQGYASEAVAAICDAAKQEKRANYATAVIAEDNAESIHFITRMGFQPDQKQENFFIYRKKI